MEREMFLKNIDADMHWIIEKNQSSKNKKLICASVITERPVIV